MMINLGGPQSVPFRADVDYSTEIYAKALCRAGNNTAAAWDIIGEKTRDGWRRMARAAIEASEDNRRYITMRFIWNYRGHNNGLFERGPNWWQITFPSSRKRRRCALIYRWEA